MTGQRSTPRLILDLLVIVLRGIGAIVVALAGWAWDKVKAIFRQRDDG